MKVFRIERERYLSSTLKGLGAAKSEGFRWNSLYTSMVYTSESRALAMLEVSVHLNMTEELPNDRYIVEIEIPENVKILDLRLKDLPKNWDSKPPILETQYIGDDFINSNLAAVLKVPSSIIPQEFNYLINPIHPDIAKIKIVSKKQLKFDERLRR
ncbi:RES family NAD+ phosphorylase [Belliella sp. DSM 107340]|uniref:RES family NAD+ phosphorylase n=1 Tax=Belliella calami TaxID=2923436 RepID=A0ABS9UIT9_9BACT|nr:RES family NAD+ phosphorylase [Belliella calami]MCH7396532.1 RES family NAD+ phosphorylase [Belliella calami]